MQSITLRRLKKEYQDILLDDNKLDSNIVSISMNNRNITDLKIEILGPNNSLYESFIFELRFVFPTSYPSKPPTVSILTPIFHPNIDNKGNICLDIIKTNWLPTYSIYDVIKIFVGLLESPNINDPLNTEAGKLYKENKEDYDKLVISKCQQYCRKIN